VVLALGNLPGEFSIRRSLRFFLGPSYVHVPWADDALEGVSSTADVLFVGVALTVADVRLKLVFSGHQRTIHALSRRIRPFSLPVIAP
jgi:uncharacterized NAD(P)/FAD-binding protein YdhS